MTAFKCIRYTHGTMHVPLNLTILIAVRTLNMSLTILIDVPTFTLQLRTHANIPGTNISALQPLHTFTYTSAHAHKYLHIHRLNLLL